MKSYGGASSSARASISVMPTTWPGTCTLSGGPATTMSTVEPCNAGVSAGGIGADDGVLGDLVGLLDRDLPDLEALAFEPQPGVLEGQPHDAWHGHELRIGVEVHLDGLVGEDQRAGHRIGAVHETDRYECALLGDRLVADAERVEIGRDVGEQLRWVRVVGQDELGGLVVRVVATQRLEQQHPADHEDDEREERGDRVPTGLRRLVS